MKYLRLYDNLVLLFHTCGGLKKEQAVRFFGDDKTEDNIYWCLRQLGDQSLITYHEPSDTMIWRGGYAVNRDVLRRRLYALWVVVDVGSENVQEITLATYPSQFFFVTTGGDAYDVAYITSKTEAQMAMREWRISNVKGEEDTVNHVALINDPSEAEEFRLKEYGFDFYCVYDENHIPIYTALS